MIGRVVLLTLAAGARCWAQTPTPEQQYYNLTHQHDPINNTPPPAFYNQGYGTGYDTPSTTNGTGPAYSTQPNNWSHRPGISIPPAPGGSWTPNNHGE